MEESTNKEQNAFLIFLTLMVHHLPKNIVPSTEEIRKAFTIAHHSSNKIFKELSHVEIDSDNNLIFDTEVEESK